MNKTGIECFDYTWNPITGCLNKCPYCYAEQMVKRLGSKETPAPECLFNACYRRDGLVELFEPMYDDERKILTFPTGFTPTFHGHRLDEPQKVKKPSTVFVCSMADLFGEWIPQAWVAKVFEVCEKAPQHQYLFLTKNIHAYEDFEIIQKDNYWYGQSFTGKGLITEYPTLNINTFLSIEPLHYSFNAEILTSFKWIIVGTETGNRKGKIVPKREWIEDIVNVCQSRKVPVFMKSSLSKIWGEKLIQEYPKSLVL